MKIDDYLPLFDFNEIHKIEVSASQDKTYRTLKEIDFSDSWIIRTLFRLRGIGAVKKKLLTEGIFTVLSDGSDEIVLGLVGRPWNVIEGPTRVEAQHFQGFDKPGYAKIVWNFAYMPIQGGTLLSTETRIRCTDAASCKKFSVYWFFIKPFSGLIRREMLRVIKKKAES